MAKEANIVLSYSLLLINLVDKYISSFCSTISDGTAETRQGELKMVKCKFPEITFEEWNKSVELSPFFYNIKSYSDIIRSFENPWAHMILCNQIWGV